MERHRCRFVNKFFYRVCRPLYAQGNRIGSVLVVRPPCKALLAQAAVVVEERPVRWEQIPLFQNLTDPDVQPPGITTVRACVHRLDKANNAQII